MVQCANGLEGAPSRASPSGESDVAEGTLRGLPAEMFIYLFVRVSPRGDPVAGGAALRSRLHPALDKVMMGPR
jgi:hypothetical protein